jgi:cyclopropane-fatty-acyl-phospholipid synthase
MVSPRRVHAMNVQEPVPAGIDTDPHGGFHYEFSNEFYRLWLDPTMTYSCAFFATGNESLEEAQMAKVDLAFRKVGLQKGHHLLDIGCGWGAAAERAAVRYGAAAVGLTLSHNQFEYAKGREREGLPLRYRLEGWETYRGPCDRLVSFGAFEHFTVALYDEFFARCRELLPERGLMLIQTITMGKPSGSFALRRFAYFLYKELFHRAELPPPETVIAHARLGGFELLHSESLRRHYVRTLEVWIRNLETNREEAARATSPDVYAKFMRYLKGAAQYHDTGETNVYQFLFRKND